MSFASSQDYLCTYIKAVLLPRKEFWLLKCSEVELPNVNANRLGVRHDLCTSGHHLSDKLKPHAPRNTSDDINFMPQLNGAVKYEHKGKQLQMVACRVTCVTYADIVVHLQSMCCYQVDRSSLGYPQVQTQTHKCMWQWPCPPSD